MLTSEDKEEIKRLIVEMTADSGLSAPENEQLDEVGRFNVVEVTARAIEVLGTTEKALRWLKTPVRSLGDRTPISLLSSPEGVTQVQDTLGRIEHGVW